MREKILIYNALIGNRLVYGFHTLPLKLDLLSKLDAFQMTRLRQILKLQPTYMNRDHTNEKVLQEHEAYDIPDSVCAWSAVSECLSRVR